jgi:hypothetical protein
MNWRPFDRISHFISLVTGSRGSSAQVFIEPMPAWGRRKDYSTRRLRAEPWRTVAMGAEIADCVSMLSTEEKQFLYWVTSEYFEGSGAIVDAGCFVGGSTVALAAGLAAARGRETWGPMAQLHSYDMFLVDDYMQQWYFERNNLRPEGNRFRNIFDANTTAWRQVLEVHDGDIMTFSWDRDLIEILFIDICKRWDVNDHVTREFFPHLIPGRSLVIQQDFFHHREYWVILTQELLQDYFEYICFIRWNTAVFRCVKAVDQAAIPLRLRELGLPELDRLLRRHIARHNAPYQVGMLSCALAFLHLDFGSIEEARHIHEEVSAKYTAEHWVTEALKDLRAALAKLD